MCGIAGFLSAHDTADRGGVEAVRHMLKFMHARGPDAEGLWHHEPVALGHRRLAIIDLDPRATQPMTSADGRYVIVFNGEIYNFRQLRHALEADGVTFRTGSDTEVLLVLFAREGKRMLPRLRGMFALAIWDTEQRQLFLARDAYGIKPLYYARTAAGFVFGSQVKAVLASGLIQRRREPAGVAGFFLWGSVPEPWTLFRDLFALPAGHWMQTRRGEVDAPVCWHDIRDAWNAEPDCKSAGEVQEWVRHAVKDSVQAHLVSDVPVSIFLSGGIDSGAILGLASELDARIEGITIGFQEFKGLSNDEMPAATEIARHYEVRHHIRMVSRAEFVDDLPRILDAMDQPSVDGVNTWFASKAAAERGYKVVLSGVGGDELFCGYGSFRDIPRIVRVNAAIRAIPGAASVFKASCAALAGHAHHPKLAGAPQFMESLAGVYFLRRGLFLPVELPELLGEDFARDGLLRLGECPPGISCVKARDATAAVGLLESTLYLRNQLLRDSDWASMAHSVELRTPLVDTQLLRVLGGFTGAFIRERGKAMLAHAPAKALPVRISRRRKTGFAVPLETWFSVPELKAAGPKNRLLEASNTPWARRWATVIVDGIARCS